MTPMSANPESAEIMTWTLADGRANHDHPSMN
jgi:hypothetical protein